MKKWLNCLLSCFLLVSCAVYAQEPSETGSLESLLFEEIPVVGVSKKAENFKDVPMSVYVISHDEMERWGVRQLYEIFQRIPGYSFYNTDYYGQYGPIGRGLQSIWRYGCSFELMNVVDFGHMTFTPHFFKSIEVARGPAGLMWGSGAEAGLLNFNIRDDLEGSEAVAEIGNNNRQSYTLMYGGKFENEGDGFFLGWHGEEQDYDLQENAFDQSGKTWKMNGENFAYNLLGKLKYKDLKFTFFQDHADHIAPTAWFGDSGLQEALETFQDDMHDQMEVVSYRAEYHVPLDFENFKLYFYHDYYKKQWWTESVALDTQRKRTVGFNGNLSLFEDKFSLNFGGDLWGEDQVSSPSLTAYWARTWGINWYDTTLSPGKTEFKNLFIQTETSILENLKFILGGRADYQKDAEPDETIYSGPRAGLLYTASEKVSLKYLYNSTKRRPQGNEVTGSSVSPEQLVAHDLVAMFDISNKIKVDLTLFTQELTEEITRVNDPRILNAFYNTGGIETRGVEWAVKCIPAEQWIVYWNGSFQNAEVKEKALGGGVVVSEAHNSDDEPLFVPSLTNFIGTEVDIAGQFKANIALRMIQDIPYLTAEGTEDEASVSFVDLTLRTRKFWDKLAFDLIFLNLFDEDERVPAFGEHSGNQNGTLEPEGRRFYVRTSLNF